MNQKPPVLDTASLIERAAEVYGLREAMRGRVPIQAVQSDAAAPVPVPVHRSPLVGTEATKHADVDLVALSEAGFIVPGVPPSPLSEEFRIAKRHLLLEAFGGQTIRRWKRGV